MALFVSAKIHKIELFSNTSGAAITQSNNKFSQFLISISGYPLSSFSAFVFFYFIHQQNYYIILITLAALSLINLIFFVRNAYGIFWVISFLLILLSVLYFDDEFMKFAISVFFSSIILTESTISAFQILIISYRNPQESGDAFNLKKITFLPSIFWALLFVIQAVFFLYITVFSFFPYINTLNFG